MRQPRNRRPGDQEIKRSGSSDLLFSCSMTDANRPCTHTKMNISRWVVAALCLLHAPSGATAQTCSAAKQGARSASSPFRDGHRPPARAALQLDRHRRAVGAAEAAGERCAHQDALARHALARWPAARNGYAPRAASCLHDREPGARNRAQGLSHRQPLSTPVRDPAVPGGALSVRPREQAPVRAPRRVVRRKRHRGPGDGQHRDGRGGVHASRRLLERLVPLVQPRVFSARRRAAERQTRGGLPGRAARSRSPCASARPDDRAAA